mmetsp:Transcript_102841/g.329908  ORF Transcript_102841/g.329908 Transcript_102841/m.329908 type:complete len:258 (-) Transcript_102841:464-1237(-)
MKRPGSAPGVGEAPTSEGSGGADTSVGPDLIVWPVIPNWPLAEPSGGAGTAVSPEVSSLPEASGGAEFTVRLAPGMSSVKAGSSSGGAAEEEGGCRGDPVARTRAALGPCPAAPAARATVGGVAAPSEDTGAPAAAAAPPRHAAAATRGPRGPPTPALAARRLRGKRSSGSGARIVPAGPRLPLRRCTASASPCSRPITRLPSSPASSEPGLQQPSSVGNLTRPRSSRLAANCAAAPCSRQSRCVPTSKKVVSLTQW